MVDAVRMNVDQGTTDEGPYHPQVPERRAFEPTAMRKELVEEGLDGACRYFEKTGVP
jgi:hypothetical protein